jgi:hypothetical protein
MSGHPFPLPWVSQQLGIFNSFELEHGFSKANCSGVCVRGIHSVDTRLKVVLSFVFFAVLGIESIALMRAKQVLYH